MGDKNMKNKLKIMIVALLSMVIVTGCGTKSPTEVVNDYFNEIKKAKMLKLLSTF